MTGPLYELPRDVGPTALYINVDLFNELGVPLPDPEVPMTWDEVIATGIALTTDGNGLHPNEEGFDAENVQTMGLGTITVPGWGLGPIFANGGRFVSEDGRTWIAHEDQNTIDAMQFLSDLVHVHRITPPPSVLEGINVWDLFNTGRVGMNWNGRWATTGFREQLDFEWDVRPYPVGSSGEIRSFAEGCSVSGWSGSVGLGIIAGSKGAEHPEQAYRFIEYIYGPAGQLAQAALGYNIPAQMELANTDAFLQPGQAPANAQVFLEAARCQLPGPLVLRAALVCVAAGALGPHVAGRGSGQCGLRGGTPCWTWPATCRRGLTTPGARSTNSAAASRARATSQPGGGGRAGLAMIAAGGPGMKMRLRPHWPQASNTRREALWAWLFILPVLAGFMLFVLGPMLASFGLSFTEWDLLSPAEWTGTRNWQAIFSVQVVHTGQAQNEAGELLYRCGRHRNIPETELAEWQQRLDERSGLPFECEAGYPRDREGAAGAARGGERAAALRAALADCGAGPCAVDCAVQHGVHAAGGAGGDGAGAGSGAGAEPGAARAQRAAGDFLSAECAAHRGDVGHLAVALQPGVRHHQPFTGQRRLPAGGRWLSDESSVKPSLMLMGIWSALGFQMLIYLAALQAVPGAAVRGGQD